MASKKINLIKLSKSSISSKEINEVSKVLKSEYLGMGPVVKKFEKLLSKYFNKYVSCTSSGTAAIQLALEAHGIGKNDEVIVPSITYVASFQAIKATGATPIPCDINLHNLLIDTNDLIKRITKRTKAIMPVHYSGDICNLSELIKISKRYNLLLIHDAAHAFGSKFNGKILGSQNGTFCFSFDGIKNITSGEGGCVVTSSKKIDNLVKNSRSLGVIKDHDFRYFKKRNWYFDVKRQGWRYHMSDIFAAIGLIQFKRKNYFFNIRKKLARNYDKLLMNNKHISSFKRNYKDFKNIQNLQSKLLMKKIETGIHYFPNHKLSFFNNDKKNILNNTDKIFKEIITLPLHVDLKFSDQIKILNVITNIIIETKNNKKSC